MLALLAVYALGVGITHQACARSHAPCKGNLQGHTSSDNKGTENI